MRKLSAIHQYDAISREKEREQEIGRERDEKRRKREGKEKGEERKKTFVERANFERCKLRAHCLPKALLFICCLIHTHSAKCYRKKITTRIARAR